MSGIGLQRAARIKAIHAICRKQGIDEDARRALQNRITGCDSLSAMSLLQLGDVLDHLNRTHAAKANEWRFVFDMPAARQAHAKKIYRLAERVGKLLDPPAAVASVAYVEGITRQMTGCDHPIKFCDADDLHKVVQALEVYLKRKEG